MGRRKKEPKSVHRKTIAAAASRLFQEKGVSATSMDDIAKEAGYSKATLYILATRRKSLAFWRWKVCKSSTTTFLLLWSRRAEQENGMI